MANQPYFPIRDAEQATWYQNLLTKIEGYHTALGLTTPELGVQLNELRYLHWIWQTWLPAWRGYGEGATEFRDLVATGTSGTLAELPPLPDVESPEAVPVGAQTRLFKNIARWKTAPGYTEVIGQDLQIIGAEMPDGPTAPEPKGKVVGGVPQLTFVKSGHQGVYIESQRQAEPGWAFLAIDTQKPYIDTRPVKVPGQAEWREYRLKFWDGAPGLPPGDWSDTLRLTAEG